MAGRVDDHSGNSLVIRVFGWSFGLGYAEKWERLAFRQQLLLDIEERLQNRDCPIRSGIGTPLRRVVNRIRTPVMSVNPVLRHGCTGGAEVPGSDHGAC
jgi:hypothetical protein